MDIKYKEILIYRRNK